MPDIRITIDALKNLPDAQKLLRRAKKEMVHAGTWTSTPKNFTRTMLLRIDNEPASVMCFAPIGKTEALESKIEGIEPLAGNIIIMGAYTVNKFRGKGAYRLLWNQLLKTYKDNPDYWVIRSGAHKKNTVSIDMQRRQGRDFFEQGATHYRSRYWLRETKTQRLIRKLNIFRAKTIGLPFKESTEYSEG